MSTASSGSLPGEKLNVLILAVSQALFMVATITVMTFSGVVGQTLTAVPALATLPVAMMMVGTVFFTLPASLLMKRIGRRNGFLIGTLAGGFTGGLVCVAGIALGSFWLFSAGSVFLGLYQGFAMYYRFAAADVASLTFRSKAMSLVMAGGVAAALLAPWNASQAQDLIPGVPNAGPYLVISLVSLLAAVLISRLRVPPGGEPDPNAEQRPLKIITRQFTFRVAVLNAAVGYGIMSLLMTATPLAMRAQGFSLTEISLVMQWHVLGMFAPSFFTGNLIARYGFSRIMLAGASLLLITALISFTGNSLGHFFVALLLLGIGWNFMFIGGSALLTHSHTEAERGKVQGMNDLLMFSLVAIASLLSGTLLAVIGWTAMNAVALPIVAATALVVALFAVRVRRQAETAV